MGTKMKGKAIIGILMAVIMLASVFALMAGSVEAYSVGGEYNIIEKDDGGAIRIEADTTSTVELQTVKLTVTGVAGDEIKVEGENVIFKRGADDTPTEINVTAKAPWFKDTIDKDGNRTYAVEFNDTGIYMIRVDVTGPAIIDGISNPRIGDYETVEITVSEKSVAFDVPPIAIIGDKITIRGTANSGTYISVFVDDNLYSQMCNLVIEDGEFSKEVRTTDIGMRIFDIAELKAYIDCNKRPGEDRPSRSPDGATKVFMVLPWLTASLSTDSVDQEGDFIVYGSAPGSTEVVILCVPPRGGVGKSLLDKDMKGLSHKKASVSTTDYTYSKKMTVQEDADSGVYYIIVLSAGRDGYWGMTGAHQLDEAFEKKYGITDLAGPAIATKSQDDVVAIFEDLTQSPGSDDLMQILALNVSDIAKETLILNPIADVVVDDPLVVTGETSRKDGSIIWITVKRQYQEIVPQAAIATDNSFSATFDTTGAQPGTYTVNANDGYGYTTATSVNIIAEAPP